MWSRSDLVRPLVNGAGIVVSILLAFGIDASWDARSERRAEEAFIDGIREEFEMNLVRIDDLLEQHRQSDVWLEGFFDAPAPTSEDDAQIAVRSLVGGLLVGDLLDPSTGTLEMLIASGQLALISDIGLRDLLWTWKTQVEDLEDETTGMQSNVRDGRQLLGRLGARGVNRDLRPSYREQYARLRSSQELSAQAQTVLVDSEIYRDELTALRFTTELVLARID